MHKKDIGKRNGTRSIARVKHKYIRLLLRVGWVAVFGILSGKRFSRVSQYIRDENKTIKLDVRKIYSHFEMMCSPMGL